MCRLAASKFDAEEHLALGFTRGKRMTGAAVDGAHLDVPIRPLAFGGDKQRTGELEKTRLGLAWAEPAVLANGSSRAMPACDVTGFRFGKDLVVCGV